MYVAVATKDALPVGSIAIAFRTEDAATVNELVYLVPLEVLGVLPFVV